MKMMFILSSLAPTGPGFVVQALVNELVKENDITLLTISDTSATPIELDPRVKTWSLEAPNGNLKDVDLEGVNRYVDRYDIDVTFSHGLRADIINARLNPKRKIFKLSTSHNNPFEDYPALYGFVKGELMALLQMQTFRKLDYVVTLNPKLEQLHRRFLGGRKVSTIINGVSPAAIEDVELKKMFGVVATFNARKNQKEIVLAMQHVNSNSLVMWGTGPDFDEMQQLVQGTGIEMPGFENDKTKIFSSFKVFVSASKSEGMPLSVLEAASLGMPLILKDIPAHRYIADFLPKKGVSLYRNEEELSAIMSDYVAHPEVIDEVRQPILDSYRENFTTEKMASRYMGLIRENVSRK